ncbi:excinuclease ABC subunit UvrC [Neochlamydia sp. AcF84]|uniref:excinuclease ABC subunit UvrC n=1 Tax=Neochlamydia sp. AcF84 TaxID=2315858 RepID=UPI00140A3991|nr:excinuclease ABC subunit UvrC [Neochlamydia sp. AcF84]
MSFDLKKLDLFPTQPGVYLMKGEQNEILYVGKANNLRQRVKQYFAAGRDGRIMVPFLIAKVEEIDTIVVNSEKEALLLENNLIKQYQPRYNALLKDDKSYIALKINNRHPWPMVSLIRYRGKPKSDGYYFGPYTSALAARHTLDLIQRIFPLRQCSDQELVRRHRPCILYDIKRCIAPCVNKCTKEEYNHYMDGAIKFLRGQDKEVLQDLKAEMERQSEALEFERAGEILQTIRQIERTIETQKVDKPLGEDADAFGIFRQGDEAILCQLLFRAGKLVGSRRHNFSQIAQNDHELLESFLLQNYDEQAELPHEILLSAPVDNPSAIAEILSSQRKRGVRIYHPQRGNKLAMVEMAIANAKASFHQEKDLQAVRERTLLEMEERFHLNRYPERIECFDISNMAGTTIVATMVAFTNGQKDSNRYRKYKIRTIDQSNDYASMQEALNRRYLRAKEENDLPDLLIVDGGKGHLNMALKLLADLDIATVDVIGLAKERGRHDRGMTEEQVFLPGVKDPLLLHKTSPVLFLLQQIRDEAHRTAITYHRHLRTKKTIKSSLDDIPGIGPKKRALLLKHFGSVKKIREATLEEISQLPRLTQKDIKALTEYLKNAK